mmetsp:Transcript_36943/g.60131  ORF Transcript_36943/g.60131 Transcript_36943/m.60131 type:complete len:99 (+) Transcript_36943:1148-1444(+)
MGFLVVPWLLLLESLLGLLLVPGLLLSGHSWIVVSDLYAAVGVVLGLLVATVATVGSFLGCRRCHGCYCRGRSWVVGCAMVATAGVVLGLFELLLGYW